MLTSLVEKHDICFTQRDVQYMLMIIVGQSLILILTVVSALNKNLMYAKSVYDQQKSDVCQVLKNLSSNLTAPQKHRNERNN